MVELYPFQCEPPEVLSPKTTQPFGKSANKSPNHSTKRFVSWLNFCSTSCRSCSLVALSIRLSSSVTEPYWYDSSGTKVCMSTASIHRSSLRSSDSLYRLMRC